MRAKESIFQKFAEKFSIDPDRVMEILKATAFRQRPGSPPVTDEQMTALLIVADQHGLNPFTREIYAFPEKQNGIVPVVGVDGWSRIINQHPQFDGLEFRASETVVTPEGAKPCPEWMECVMYRKDRAHPTAVREYLDEVYREAFSGNKDGRNYTVAGPWQSHTKRFLRHKTMIQAARLVFGFVGIYDQDEAERIIDGQAETVSASTDLGPYTGGGTPSDKARSMATTLVSRATKAGGAWQAALEYAGQNFNGIDLSFITQELEKAKATSALADPVKPSPPATQAAEPSQQAPAATTGKAGKGKAGSVHPSEILDQARRSLQGEPVHA